MTRPLPPAILACALALCVSACASTTSTSNFKGAEREAAQAIANLQSAASAGEGSKICADYLAHAIVVKLGGKKGCERAIKNQLIQVDNLEAKIEAVKVAPGGGSATATVKSIRYGKSTLDSVSLVREGASWKISGP